MLSPEWEKILGGQQEIVNNIVLKEAKTILNLFSTKGLHGELLLYSKGKEDSYERFEIPDYAKIIKNNKYDAFFQENDNPDEKWKLYSGGESGRNFFISNRENLKTIFNTYKWPEKYQLYNMPIGVNENETIIYYFPTIWKYLKSDDLINYLDKVKIFYNKIYDKTDEKYKNNIFHEYKKILKGLNYITGGNYPDGFMLIFSELGAHGGWGLNSLIRDFELEIVVLENISENPIKIGSLYYYENNTKGVVEYNEFEKNINKKEKISSIYPSEFLRIDEKLIIPIKINFVDSGLSNFFRKNKDYLPIVDSTTEENKNGIIKYYNPYGISEEEEKNYLFSKKASLIKDEKYPVIPERFTFLKAIKLKSIDLDDKNYLLREANWKQFNLFTALERGSCPYIYTKKDNLSPWINEGTILVGATSQELETTEIKELNDYHGKIKISELEDEIFFLKSLKIILRKNNKIVKEIIHHSLSKKPIIITKGNPSIFDKNIKNIDFNKVTLQMRGYYIPFDSIKYQKEIINNQ